jgi:septum site-determining protein MinC
MTENSMQLDPFRLKGRLYTLTVLELLKVDGGVFAEGLEKVSKEAPKMFAHTPVILDLSQLSGESFDLKGICEQMRDTKMIPVAVQGASVVQQKAAIAAGLAVFSTNSKKDIEVSLARVQQSEQVLSNKDTTEPTPVPTSGSKASKVISTPVRSGQQIYAKDADLIVLSSVGRGAELLADGHIHVYGSLRGRALAGLNGNLNARIFCSKLDAELISIAGQYLMPEQLLLKSPEKAKQVYLKDGHLLIEDI